MTNKAAEAVKMLEAERAANLRRDPEAKLPGTLEERKRINRDIRTFKAAAELIESGATIH